MLSSAFRKAAGVGNVPLVGRAGLPSGWHAWLALGWAGNKGLVISPCPVAAFKGPLSDTPCPEGPAPYTCLLPPRGEVFLILLLASILLMSYLSFIVLGREISRPRRVVLKKAAHSYWTLTPNKVLHGCFILRATL